ncbi:MAG: hypothetical protein EA377_06360 [Phycisphaerales bacterium]|nr:MAG: hypothetical protein EA377_06360 [Phycisphaerales bacterium]
MTAPLLILIGIVIVSAWALGMLFRRAGAPGAMVLAGVLIGALAGPTTFGRMMPEQYERWVAGGAEHRAELRAIVHEQEASLLAAEAAGFDQEALEEKQREHRAIREPIEAQWRQAKWEHTRPLRWAALISAGLILLTAGRVEGKNHQPASRAQHLTAVNIGFWLATLPAAVVALLGHLWWQWPPEALGAAGAALAIGVWRMPRTDAEATEDAEPGGVYMLLRAGWLSGLIAVVLLGWSIVYAELNPLWVGVLATIPAGILIGYRRLQRPSSGGEAHQPALDLLLAAIAALVVMQIDLIGDFSFWPCLIVAIVSMDGRWTSALVGTLTLGGRRTLRSMRLLLAVVAIGPTQLAVVGIGLSIGLIGPEVGLALVCGAVLAEISGPLRSRVARETRGLEHFEG